MLNRKGSMFEVRVSLAIVRIFIVCTIAFYTFSQLATQTLFERGGTLDDILAAHGKVHVVLPNIAVTPNEPIVLKHLEDDLTPEERMKDKIYRWAFKLGAQYSIEPSLILAVVQKESRYQPDVNGSGAIGLMQIIPSCHTDRIARLEVTDIWDPYSNMLIGTDLLAELVKRYKDTGLALMCYNMGEGGALYKYNNHGYSGYAYEVLRIKEEIERSELYGTFSHQTKVASSESRDS